MAEMNINAILNQARKNTKEVVNCKVSRYNTDVKPPKKLPRSNVDPNAIKALLQRKKDEETNNLIVAQKKKEELQKLRQDSKSTKKANAMAKRTKDNLKVYRGEDVLGLYPDPKKKRRSGAPSPPLSPEQDRRHKAFMKNIVPKAKVPGISDEESGDEYKEPVLEEEERKRKKIEKNRAKARNASNLEFSDLLQLAEKQKNKSVEASTSSEDESDEDSDGSVDAHGRPLTAEERYQRERRKRRELEERLKMVSTTKKSPTSVSTSSGHKEKKIHKSSSSGNLANFKIGKLNSGMSEESKRAKVKALMEKLSKSSKGKTSSQETLEKSEKLYAREKERKTEERIKNKEKKMTKSQYSPSLSELRTIPKKNNSDLKHRQNGVMGQRSRDLKSKHRDKDKGQRSNLKTEKSSKVMSNKISKDSRSLQTHKSPSKPQERMKQTEIGNHFKSKKEERRKNDTVPSTSKQKNPPPISNPYKHTVVKAGSAKRPISDTFTDPWAKQGSNKGANPYANTVKKPKAASVPPAKCTLSVTSESVKTNYPGVASLDPYIEAYKRTGKVMSNLTPEMAARVKAALILKAKQNGRGNHPPPAKRRYGVIADDSEDEYDSELEDFIADDDDEPIDEDVDISSHIKSIFGYDRSKYGRESEWELSRMEASYKDIEKEEKRSLKIAQEEDALEAKLEEERMQRMSKKPKKK